MSQTSKPVAGDEIEFLCVVVMRGISAPNVVDFTSKIEDASGVAVFPIPIAADDKAPSLKMTGAEKALDAKIKRLIKRKFERFI